MPAILMALLIGATIKPLIARRGRAHGGAVIYRTRAKRQINRYPNRRRAALGGSSYDPATWEAHTPVAHDRRAVDPRIASDYRDRGLDCSLAATPERSLWKTFEEASTEGAGTRPFSKEMVVTAAAR